MRPAYGKLGKPAPPSEKSFIQPDRTSWTMKAASAKTRREGLMSAHRCCLILLALGLAGLPAPAQFRKRAYYPAITSAPAFLDSVAATHRDAVSQIVKAPTLTTKATEDAFAATVAVYSWMLDHPDRVSNAWQRLEIPCVEIKSIGNNQFTWSDEHGSKLTWEPVGKLADGVIWHATGQVKPAALLPMVPVKAVAVLRYPGTPTTKAGVSNLKPEVEVWFQTDSRAANAILRLLGPAAPKLAEDAAGQLLYFFSGIAGYLQKHPDEAKSLLAEKKK